MANTIGINQRIPISILESALISELNANYAIDYAKELAATEYTGINRIQKTANVINKIIHVNPLHKFILAHKEALLSALHYNSDKSLILISLVNASYTFCYDTTALLGKYFHVQQQVSSELIQSKLANKYGSNRSLPNGLYCILPMLIEAGFISRPNVGIYEKKHLDANSEIAYILYKQSFIANNPLADQDADYEYNAYFEFLR